MEDCIRLQTPLSWSDYELIDSGAYEKLERFGSYVLVRPEPQAVWDRSMSEAEWKERADARFYRKKAVQKGEEQGYWECRPGMPDRWWVSYPLGDVSLRMRLALTAFKHVGLFPEQAGNWHFMVEQIRRITAIFRKEGSEAVPQVLNLFAYTGGATLAACGAGAQVTHVDSVKAVVNWAADNLEASSMQGVRWMVEDALKFARREVRRGHTYQGIVLDPPAYGRGPDGERWILEENINELLKLCGALLDKQHSFLVLNLYSMGMSPLLARTALRQLVGEASGEQMGELCFSDRFGKMLPLGVYCRLWRE